MEWIPEGRILRIDVFRLLYNNSINYIFTFSINDDRMNLYVLIVEMVIERWNHYDYS